jgi:hypothetical protein
MLDEALEAILAVTPAQAAEFWLADGGVLTLERFRGVGAATFGSRPSLLVGEGLPGAAANATSAIVVHDSSLDPRFEREEIAAPGCRPAHSYLLSHEDGRRACGCGAREDRIRIPDELRAEEPKQPRSRTRSHE